MNISKTNYVLFVPPDNIKIHDPTLNNEYKLEFGSETIDQVSHVKFLGLKIDKNLNWSVHANDLIDTLSSCLYMMNNVKNFLPKHTMKSLYYSFFYSHLSLGILLWGPSISKWHQEKLKVKQNFAVRSIMKANSRASTANFYKDLSILKFDDIVNLELCKFMFRVNRNEIPPNVTKFFNNYQHDYRTRYNHESKFDQRRNFQIVNESFLSVAPHNFSRLSVNVRNSPSVKSFAKNLKRCVTELSFVYIYFCLSLYSLLYMFKQLL